MNTATTEIYGLLIIIFIVLAIMIPVNINLIRIYNKKMLAELEAIHKTIRALGWKTEDDPA